jgi:polysaccharide biosynthesis protein PslJ
MLRVLAGGGERGPAISAAVVVASLAVLALTVVVGYPAAQVCPAVIAVVVAAVGYRELLRWPPLIAAMILVILFIPIKRYALPGNLPFDLEPYRLLMLVIISLWAVSLLVDSRVTVRRTAFDRPIALVLLCAFASVLVNIDRISSDGLDQTVIKELMFLLSFVLVFYLVVSVTRTREQLDHLVLVLVGGGAVVGVGALIEARTGTNLFDAVAGRVPLLSQSEAAAAVERGGADRVVASAQNPIPLGAMLVMLSPLAVYAARARGQVRWWIAAGLLVVSAFGTVSRTTIDDRRP